MTERVQETAGKKIFGRAGFTLVETLAAVTLLVVAVVSPLLLTERALSSAYYARDQITASYLAQEAIETVRQVRDDNILMIAENQTSGIDLFNGVPASKSCNGAQQYFTVDATQTNSANVIKSCSIPYSPATCPRLKTKNNLYGYGAGWTPTNFSRTAYACYTDSTKDEVKLSVTVSWQTSSLAQRSFTMTDYLYRWIQDGSGS